MNMKTPGGLNMEAGPRSFLYVSNAEGLLRLTKPFRLITKPDYQRKVIVNALSVGAPECSLRGLSKCLKN